MTCQKWRHHFRSSYIRPNGCSRDSIHIRQSRKHLPRIECVLFEVHFRQNSTRGSQVLHLAPTGQMLSEMD